MYTLLGYKKCSTCNNAEKFLREKNIDYIYRDIKEDKLSEEEIKELINLSNKDIKYFFNTSGLIYRNLNLKDKLSDMSYEEKIRLLASDGMLVKRPILILDDKVLVGFKTNEWDEL